MRRRARVDGNHTEIVAALESHGWLVLSLASMGRGVPDLLVWHPHSGMELVEVKAPKGALTDDQVEFLRKGWPVVVMRSVQDVSEWASTRPEMSGRSFAASVCGVLMDTGAAVPEGRVAQLALLRRLLV